MEIDFLAKRYGVLPSEFLKSDNFEFVFNLFVAQIGCEHDARERRKATRG